MRCWKWWFTWIFISHSGRTRGGLGVLARILCHWAFFL
jgi:hypothetical protein